MSTSIEQILNFFDHLPDFEKRKVASEIILRTIRLDLPPLTDEEFIFNAETLF